jgi:glyoxylate/hydroxypyruvate reductase A
LRRHVVLYVGAEARGRAWARFVAEETGDLELRVWPEAGDLAEVAYLAAWIPPAGLFGKLPNLKAVFSVGAGVDQLDLAAIPAHLPLARMIEPGIEACLTAWVCMAVLALHRDLPAYVAQQRAEVWRALPVRPPAACRVGMLGTGRLGSAAAKALTGLGFPVRGWSRSSEVSFEAVVSASDVLVCLLPLTAQTRGILDARTFALLPRGAGVVNAGRGGHLVEADLRAALASGQVGAAVLDVTAEEPLPAGHAFWGHERIFLTPHVGAVTQTETGIAALVANVRRHLRGEALEGLVDRDRGY